MKLLTRVVYREIHNLLITKSASILNKSFILFPSFIITISGSSTFLLQQGIINLR